MNICIITPHRMIPYHLINNQYNITKEEIESTINKLKTKKARGPDKITNIIIKNIKSSIQPILLTIYNQQ